jgi:hypothetical protein
LIPSDFTVGTQIRIPSSRYVQSLYRQAGPSNPTQNSAGT